MTDNKLTKPANQLLKENKGLSDKLEKALKEIEFIKQQKNKLKSQVTKRSAELKKANEGLRNDLIEIKRSKTALQESENNLSAVYQTMSEGLAIHELVYNSSGEPIDYIISDVNPAFEKITGLQRKNISGMMATDAYSVPEAPYIEIYNEVASTGIHTSFETYFPPMMKYFHISVFSPERGKFATIFQDITDRKLADAEMQLMLNRFYNILEGMNNGILLVTNENRTEFINQTFCDIFGLKESPSELINLKADEMLAKIKNSYKDPEAALRRISEIVNQGMTVIGEDVTLGSEKTLLRDFIPIKVDGKLTGRLWNHIDITERKLAEEALSFHSQLLSNVYDAVFSSDSNYVITYWNKAAEKMFGWTKEEALGKNSGEMLKPKIEGSSRDTERSKLRYAGRWEGEVMYIRKNGTYFFVEVNSTVLKNPDGKDIGNVVVAHEITERKKMEAVLRESEKKFRELVKYAPTAIYELDFANRKFSTVNDAMCQLSGYSREELLSLDALDLLVSESKAIFLSRIKSCFNGEKPDENVEYEVKNKGGQIINAVLNMKFNFNEQGIPVSAMVVGHDITARKKAEAELRDSETKFLSLFNLSPLPMALSTVEDGIFRDVNESFIRDSGFTKEEIVGQTSANLNLFINAGIREQFLTNVQNQGSIYGIPCDFRLRSGKIRNCLLSSSTISINGVFYLLSTIQDITDILMTKEALKESEERFRALAENIPDMIVRFDKNLHLLYGNKAVTDRTNLPVDSMIGKTAKEYGAPSDSTEQWEQVAREVLDSGEPRRIEHTNNWLDKTRVFDALLVPEKDKNGKVNSVISIARDITEMKRAENILKDSEQRLKYHLENSPLAVVEWDKDFKIIQWSNEAEKIFGLKKKETMGIRIDLLNIIYPEDILKVEHTIKRLVSGKELKVISQNRNITKTGEIKECIWYNSVLLNENGVMSSVMSLVEDITLLRSTEKELIESRESYKELVSNARTVIIKMDTTGRCTYVNEYALEFFGFKSEEMLSIPVMDTIMPKKESTGRNLLEMAEDIIEDPDNFSVNINENIKKNGELVWVEWHNKALYDKSGIRTGHIGIGIDVTEKKKAEEALKENERKLWSVLDATLESIYMFDRNGIICMLNSTGVERLNKRSENEIIGHHFSEFMATELASARQEKLEQVFKRGIPLEFEDERDCRIFHHNYFPVFKDSQVIFVVTYSSDITNRKRSESKLIESEDRFRTIAESLTVMISIIRICDSAITFTNEPFEKTFGFGANETSGEKYRVSFYNASDFGNVREMLKAGGVIDNLEIPVKKTDGTQFWIMLSVRKINFMNEPSYLAVSIDITESKRAQLELLRLNRILNAHSKSSQAMMHSSNEFDYINEICRIIIEDCGHTMVWVGYAQNDEAKSVIPVAYYGFENKYIDKLQISWGDNERGRGPTGTAIRTGAISMCRNMQTDPTFEPWREAAVRNGYASSLVYPLISDGKSFGALSIYSKEPDPFLEAEISLLSDLADDLAYGISFLRLTESERAATRAIKENEMKLKELIDTKDKFFNIVAHDLKNPFTSLLGASELLYDNIDQMTKENIRSLALILNDSAKGGYAILQNLLDWSRSQTGLIKFNPENINLKDIINENISNHQLQVTNKEIEMISELTDDLLIYADKNMINTVLRNLLSNAVKYTFKNGTIVVRVSCSAEEAIVSVKDSGIGITKEDMDNLFRLENSLSLPGTEKEKGTGLGLKLCKEFTEMMGGRIWVISEFGQGSIFNFTIPFNSVKNQEKNLTLTKTI